MQKRFRKLKTVVTIDQCPNLNNLSGMRQTDITYIQLHHRWIYSL